MARKQAIVPEVNFTKGLHTEATAFRYPENSAVEIWNTVLNLSGSITRRPGVDVEDSYVMLSVDAAAGTEAYAEYHWQTVSTQGTQSYIVIQRGSLLQFFHSASTTDYSAGGSEHEIELNDYIPAGSTSDPSIYQCSFTEGRGKLVVANPAIDPILVEHVDGTDTLLVTAISIKYRDFTGIEDDGFALAERPTSDVATLKTDNPEHYYNLLNQGWHLTDALTQWDTARTDLPSNADAVGYYRNSDTDPFDNNRVDKFITAALNVPAPKGHFILDAGSPSRNEAMGDEGFSGATVPEAAYSTIDLSALTTIHGGAIIRESAAWDTITAQLASNSTIFTAATDWDGKTFSTAQAIGAVTILSPKDANFDVSGKTVTFEVYGKTGAAPATSTDGTLIGTKNYTTTGAKAVSVFIKTTDYTTTWDHVWVRVTTTGTNTYVAEISMMESSPTFYRPSHVTFYAGRIFYGGLPNEGENNNIYFSQVIERDGQYGKCYQKNDPTNESFFDLLSDDGGVITIPEMGELVAQFPFQNALIIIATNGVWLISGSNRGPFLATDYSVRKISSISTVSKSSIVDRRGLPFWWAEDGIYTVTYDANYDSYAVTSLTDNTIKSFIQAIPRLNRRYIKGAYDRYNDTIYWLYNDTASLASTDYYTYNHVLLMDGRLQAFYPWEMGQESLLVKGMFYATDITGTSTPKIKLLIEHTDGDQITFAEFKNTTTWKDWTTYATDTSTAAEEVDYDSYFVTAYKVHGETQKRFQGNYVYVFMETEENASVFVQSIHEFTNTSSSGRWSTPQQCYRSDTRRDVNYRRLKLRGSGHAIQLKFYSESGKPFTIVGWSTNESGNDAI